jgi:hypothetical protein
VATDADTAGRHLGGSAGLLASAVVRGPASSSSGDVPQFADTTGKVLSDSGIATSNVVQAGFSSGAVVASELAVYASATGRVLTGTGGLLYSRIAQGPISSTIGDVVQFNGTAGNVLSDTGIPTSDLQRKSTPGFTSVAFNAANFSQSGSGSWVVPGIYTMGYVTAGRICTYTVYPQPSTVGAGANNLIITLAGAPATASFFAAAVFFNGATGQGVPLLAYANGSQINLFRSDGAAFVSASLSGFCVTVTYAY